MSSTPYRKITFEEFLEVVNIVKDGGYSLKSYNRYSRLKTEVDGRLVVNSPGHIRKFKMNIGTIVEAPMLKVRLQRRTLGSIEENFILNLSPGDTFVFGGKIIEFEKVDGINVFVKKSKSKTPKLTVYAGGRQPLTSQLAQTVQKVIGNKNHWVDLPIQIQEWLTLPYLVNSEMQAQSYQKSFLFLCKRYKIDFCLTIQNQMRKLKLF